MNESNKCYACGGDGADKYTWCRPCIKRAARGAARYFLDARAIALSFDDPDMRNDLLRRQTNKYEKKFKRRLKRRSISSQGAIAPAI